MKLLLDQNLPRTLLPLLQRDFPDSSHVVLLGLSRATDLEIWRRARDEGFAIVTKDSDFHELGLLRGFPPKVVWLRIGNCSIEALRGLMLGNISRLLALGQDEQSGFITLP